MKLKQHKASLALIAVVVAIGVGLGLWKSWSLRGPGDATQAEIPEVITAATAQVRDYQPSASAIGTVVALRSIVLRNELPGTVHSAALKSGEVVEAGSILLRLDTSVEEAELAAQQAEEQLAATRLKRAQKLVANGAISVEELDQATAQNQVMRAQIERTRAVIARKVLRAPFRARVGIADVHAGQYLDQGTQLTTLQGVDDARHIDFVVSQQVAGGLRTGDVVEIPSAASGTDKPIEAHIAAIDARIDPQTRNAIVRARVENAPAHALAPGESVRVRVPSAPMQSGIVIPTSALRRSPEGDHVFVLSADKSGSTRAHLRRVQIGAVLGDDILIQQGLKAGERIAASGSFKLRDSALVALAAGDSSTALQAAN